MTDVDEHGRPEPPLEGDEVTMLRAYLDYQRATLAWKCEGLGAEGLRATVGPSTMTLGGLLKHMALVEDSWFTRWLHGRDIGAPWNAVDWDADGDWEWNSAADDTPERYERCGRTPSSVPEQRSRRRWTTAVWTGSQNAAGPTDGHRACGGSSAT
jgi:uncharacterized damage-inducible protein DinB